MKRAIVRNSHEYQVWVNAFNGKMNCYTTVYDFEHFAVDKAVENTVILDRMFLDFDAHGQPLQTAFDDLKKVLNQLEEDDIYFVPYFSGNGFHVIVYGEVANDIRSIQQTFSDLAKTAPTLDNTGIQINRLKRIPNTVNLSSDGPYFCIPITKEDIEIGLAHIVNKASKGNYPSVRYGNKLQTWKEVKPIEESDIEVVAPKPPGELPILPCLYNSIMVENPGHFARVYLVQWYRDILAIGERNLDGEKQEEIVSIIMDELKTISSNPNVWLDWDEVVTEKHVRFVVRGGYHAPSCKDKLIPQGYCIGKCWRYPDHKYGDAE